MNQYVFNNGRIRLYNDRFELCKIELGFVININFEQAYKEEQVKYYEIKDIVIKEATLIRKGYLQVITDKNMDRSITEFYQASNDKFTLIIADKKMNNVAIQVKKKLMDLSKVGPMEEEICH